MLRPHLGLELEAPSVNLVKEPVGHDGRLVPKQRLQVVPADVWLRQPLKVPQA